VSDVRVGSIASIALRTDPNETSANASAALERLKPGCLVYQATAASTSSTIYRTFTVAIDMVASTAMNSSLQDQLNLATASTTQGRDPAS
jgi:hypothetical protein